MGIIIAFYFLAFARIIRLEFLDGWFREKNLILFVSKINFIDRMN